MSPSRGQNSPQASILGDKITPRVGDKNPPVEVNTNTQCKRQGTTDLLDRMPASNLTSQQCRIPDETEVAAPPPSA